MIRLPIVLSLIWLLVLWYEEWNSVWRLSCVWRCEMARLSFHGFALVAPSCGIGVVEWLVSLNNHDIVTFIVFIIWVDPFARLFL